MTPELEVDHHTSFSSASVGTPAPVHLALELADPTLPKSPPHWHSHASIRAWIEKTKAAHAATSPANPLKRKRSTSFTVSRARTIKEPACKNLEACLEAVEDTKLDKMPLPDDAREFQIVLPINPLLTRYTANTHTHIEGFHLLNHCYRQQPTRYTKNRQKLRHMQDWQGCWFHWKADDPTWPLSE